MGSAAFFATVGFLITHNDQSSAAAELFPLKKKKPKQIIMYFYYFQLAEVKFTEPLYKSNVAHEAPHHTRGDTEHSSAPSRVILLDYIICIYYYIIYFSFDSTNLRSLSVSDIDTLRLKNTQYTSDLPFAKGDIIPLQDAASISSFFSFFFVY